MKKIVLVVILIVLALILSVVTYFYVWGGKPYVENFDDISHNYETIAKLSLEYYNQSSQKNGHITLFIYDDYIEDITNKDTINLTNEQKDAIKTINKKFGGGCLWVTEDAVIFWRDETKYYGLVYSENPLSTIWDMKTGWYEGVEYHRIDSNWYEIGVWGI